MKKRRQYQRLVWVTCFVAMCFGGLGYRLLVLQVFRHEELTVKASGRTERQFILEPRRGDILDAKGNPLATSTFVKTVVADPTLIGNHQAEVARAIAPILQLGESEVAARLIPRVRQNEKGQTVTNRYVVLKKKVLPETWLKVQAAMTNLSFGVDEKKLPALERAFYRDLRKSAIFTAALDDQLRVYPNGPLAAHVLGYVGMEDKEVAGHQVSETGGKDGIERQFDSKLAGVPGWRVTETDHDGSEQVAWRKEDIEPRDGFNVVLTIDSVLQGIMEKALADGMQKQSPVSISGIMVRPRTGEILAMATIPTFDPNHQGDFSADAHRNRVITDIAEPGSTFKIVVVSGALSDGLVRLTDQFDCEHGHFYFGGRILHDHESHGILSVEQIITKSSNIGAAKVGIRMGKDRLYEHIRDYGFGARTDISLPGEVVGIAHPISDREKVKIAQIPMGQGIAVTRIQMVMAMCAIANQGVLMQPMLVDRLEDREHRVMVQYQPQRVRRVISESAARMMVEALKTVVSSEGTAPKAALEHYTVAGKTGTAQKSGGAQGYLYGKYFSSFIGFFPADNPELCISVTLDEPQHGHFGGQIATPIFKDIAEQAAKYLAIKPDDGTGDLPMTENSTQPGNSKDLTAGAKAARVNQSQSAHD
ncbi:MAG: penicillin-binding protein 2 [Verrucomicrobia bacterium]|nr:MAG: penicillin-binding protein 2 [Verrucomicrobiota bacterium]